MKTNKRTTMMMWGSSLLLATSLVACNGVDDDGSKDDIGVPEDEYVFLTDAPDAYRRIDRHGAVEAGTVGIKAVAGLCVAGLSPIPPGESAGPAVDCSIRDDYNASNPAEDVTGKWVGNPAAADPTEIDTSGIAASLTILQGALHDDITALGLAPADLATAVAQAGPVLIPDTIKYDPSADCRYPNGRALEDQVLDITLAAAFLTVGDGTNGTIPDVYFLADNSPLNPVANDKPFKQSFPYLADPHPLTN